MIGTSNDGNVLRFSVALGAVLPPLLAQIPLQQRPFSDQFVALRYPCQVEVVLQPDLLHHSRVVWYLLPVNRAVDADEVDWQSRTSLCKHDVVHNLLIHQRPYSDFLIPWYHDQVLKDSYTYIGAVDRQCERHVAHA